MSAYIYSVVRLVPNPATGEFVNVGVIAGKEDGSDWLARQALNEFHVLQLADRKLLQVADDFFELCNNTIAESKADERPLPSEWLEELRADHNNVIQLSEPMPAVGVSSQAVVDSIFKVMITGEPEPVDTEDVEDDNPGHVRASWIGGPLDGCRNNKDDSDNEVKAIHKEIISESVEIIEKVASLFDNLLKAVATPALDRLYNENKTRAMKDPTYRAIEERRRRPGQNSITMYSEADGLGWDEMNTQSEIKDNLARKPWWEQIARVANDGVFYGQVNKVRHMYQRLHRGWDDTEIWGLDHALCERLGQQVLELAHIHHGYPGYGLYNNPDRWAEDLHKHGYALYYYGAQKYNEELFSKTKNKEIQEAAKRSLDLEDEAYAQAQISMRWVATYLGHLWD